MGRKKIQISPILDQRNRQVSRNAELCRTVFLSLTVFHFHSISVISDGHIKSDDVVQFEAFTITITTE